MLFEKRLLDIFQELHNDLLDRKRVQLVELADKIKTIAELRLEELLECLVIFASLFKITEADSVTLIVSRTQIRSQNDDRVLARNFLTIRSSDTTLIKHLQKDVKDVRVSLFNFVKQKNRMRVLAQV